MSKSDYLLRESLKVATCTLCPLHETRHHTVFGAGNVDASLMFIGEAPGASEDHSAVPFVGRAGETLTNMIESIGLFRDEVYICNIIKCRPPGNRDPKPGEIEACSKYLGFQIDVVRPKVICTLGRPASHTILGVTDSMSFMNGRLFKRIPAFAKLQPETMIVPIYHPAFLNRSSDMKSYAYNGLKFIKELLE